MFTFCIKLSIRRFHVVVVQWTSTKCTKKRDARAGLFVLTFSLSSSCFLKLPTVNKRTHKKREDLKAIRSETKIQTGVSIESSAIPSSTLMH